MRLSPRTIPGGLGQVTENLRDGLVSLDATSHAITYTLLPFRQTPNKRIKVQRLNSGPNAVIVSVDPNAALTDGDILQSSSGFVTSVTLTDAEANGFTVIERPGEVWLPGMVVSGVGAAGGGGPDSGAVKINGVQVTY